VAQARVPLPPVGHLLLCLRAPFCRSDHAQRARLSGRWRPPQVKDIFPQAVKVELPGGYPRPRRRAERRTSCCRRAQPVATAPPVPPATPPPPPTPVRRVPPTMTAAHPAGRRSRRRHLGRRPPPNLPEPPAWLNGFGRSQQGLAPEQCLRRATLRLAHGLEQGACQLSAACRTGSTTGSWPKLSPPHGIQRSSLIPWIDSLISVHEFPVIHRREFRHKLLQIFAFWWPPAAPSQIWPTQFPVHSLKNRETETSSQLTASTATKRGGVVRQFAAQPGAVRRRAIQHRPA
jgi:hypothetical protein